jgi:hypothetical protein
MHEPLSLVSMWYLAFWPVFVYLVHYIEICEVRSGVIAGHAEFGLNSFPDMFLQDL